MVQLAEGAAILANAGASYYLYNQIKRLDSNINELQDQIKAQIAVNGRLATNIGELERRIASIEGRLAMVEQRPVHMPMPVHNYVPPSVSNHNNYGDVPQTDPRGYNPAHQPRLQQQYHPPQQHYNPYQHQQQQPQQYQNDSGIPKPATPQYRSSSSSENRRAERISKDQLMADAQSNVK